MSMSVPPTVTYIFPQKPSDIFIDQQNAKNALGIVDNRLAELLTIAQLFPDYRKSDPDASKPTIDFRFGPIRVSGDDFGASDDTTLSATNILTGILNANPDIAAFLNDPASKDNPLYSILQTTLNVMTTALATIQNASIDTVSGTPMADRAQANLLTPYILIKTMANEAGSLLDTAFSTLSNISEPQHDQVLNVLNQLTPLVGSFEKIVSDLEAGNTNIAGAISNLSAQIQTLQNEISSKQDMGFSFLATLTNNLQAATVALSAGVGLASTVLTLGAVLSQSGKDQSTGGLLNGNTLPGIYDFSAGLLNGTGVSPGQQAFFSSAVGITSLFLLTGVKALEGGAYPAPDGLNIDPKTYNTFLFDTISKGFLASGVLGAAIDIIASGTGLSGDSAKNVSNALEFGLLASVIYVTDDNKIKENFFASVKESLEQLAQTVKEDNSKRDIASDGMKKVSLNLDVMQIALKNDDLTGFCAGCESLLESFGLSKTQITEDLTALKGFGTFIIDTLADEATAQKEMNATSLRSSA